MMPKTIFQVATDPILGVASTGAVATAIATPTRMFRGGGLMPCEI